MKLNKDLLMKIAIVAAIALIIYLVYRSRSCKDTYAEYVPDDEYNEQMPDGEYAENMFEDQAADYAEADYYTEEEPPTMLMESTLNEDQANAMFEPEM